MLITIINSLGERRQLEITGYKSHPRGIHVFLGDQDLLGLIPFLKAHDFLFKFEDESYHVKLYLFINDRTNGKEPYLDMSVHDYSKSHEDLLSRFFDNCKELERKEQELALLRAKGVIS